MNSCIIKEFEQLLGFIKKKKMQIFSNIFSGTSGAREALLYRDESAMVMVVLLVIVST